MNWVLEGREGQRMNGKFTDSLVMNKTLEEYKKMGQKKKRKIFSLNKSVMRS